MFNWLKKTISQMSNADVKVSKQSAVPRQPIKRSNPHRILICDDAAFMRMMLKNVLTQDGYEVVAEAQDGLEAIERYSEFKPDLVFMDTTMPTMDGIEATRKIMKRDSHANIVICSAMGQEELVMEAIRLGAKDFIVKPFRPEAILKAVVKIFEPWRIATPPVETEQSQTVNTTPPVQTQYTQNKTVSNTSTVNTPIRQTQSACNINDYNSYMKMLKQYYSRYDEEAFLYSEIQRFRNSNRLDKLGITSNDVIEDLLKIKKSADITQDKTTTPPVQTQRTQTQNANAIQPEEYGHDYLEKRGVDKDFGIRNDEHGDFYFFVINMSNTELINTINNQYKAIKGTWTLAPCMGEYGCIEFAATLLLWKYAINNFSKNPESYASLQIMLGDLICCAFFGMPAGEWSDKADPIINAHTDILSYEEFGKVYNYLRNNHADRIHSLEFNEGNAEKEAYRHLYTKFTETYNSSEGFTETLNFYTANGLKIKEDMHFNVVDENKDILKSLLVQEWKSVWGELKEDAQIQQLSPTITDKFYISSYRCPICGRHMYKTVFPIGSEFPIRTENGYISMKRIFTCKPCLSFFTPLPERKLSCGQYYSLRLDTPAEYDLLLETYDNHGTIYGRPDA